LEQGIDAGEQGWVPLEDLCRMLRIEENKMNVDFFRARRQFAKLGIQGAGGIIERRTDSRSVRLGVGALEVSRLG